MAGRFTPRLPGIGQAMRSPNHGPRVGFAAPDCLVLHYTGMADGSSAIARLCDPASQVSCHYLVEENGRILQLVDEERRAWCCGRSIWRGVTDMNSASVNIEIVNGGHDFGLPHFPEAQIAAVIALSRDIVERHAILPGGVLAHSDIAPGRKRDPGERFPWPLLAAAGLGRWPKVEAAPLGGTPLARGHEGDAVRDVQGMLAAIGYGVPLDGHYGAETETVLQAFQRRYRPERVDGVVDTATLDRLRAVRAAS